VSGIYNNPQYYEIAFNWREIGKEVDLFEECIRRFSGIPVKKMLELGCGNCPHMTELVRRGYHYTGLDTSEEMLAYSRKKIEPGDDRIRLINADMIDFTLDSEFDFAFIMLGSLAAESTEDLVKHFKAVASVLKPGGLYFLDWCIQYELSWRIDEGVSWEQEQDGIKVRTTYKWKPVSLARQIFKEVSTYEVDDHGKQIRFDEEFIRRAVYPQEFLRFIEYHKHFEFVGWWNLWDLDQPLDEAEKVDRPIALIRRV
jgi:SAM-dependent methyltransferase